MSVTISVDGIGYCTVPCSYCAQAREAGWADERGRCIERCDGTEREPLGPEVNLANDNWKLVASALGIFGDKYCGSLGPQEIPAVRRRAIAALNEIALDEVIRRDKDFRGPVTREVITGEDGLPHIEARGGCRIICCGMDGERLLDRIRRVDAVLAYAQEHGLGVTWG